MLPPRKHTAARDEQPAPPPRADVTGVLLCGGKSTRMRADKALLELEGRALIEYPLSVLEQVAQRVVLACGPTPRYAELGLELALDGGADGGPLAGLLAGLEASATEWTAVLACDMPRADAGVLRELLERAERDSLDACLLEIERGTQPMFAVYRRTCLQPVRDALEAGERRMISFHPRQVAGRALRVASLRPSGACADAALNVNTADELRAEAARRGTQTGEVRS
jgi:molybdopterin-guanine dinucleotide biosynthesis protein A